MTLTTPETPGARAVQVWSLHMLSPHWIRPAPARVNEWTLQLVVEDKAAMSSRMYREVGGGWSWVDRADWQDADWRGWVQRPGHSLTVALVAGECAGYVELDRLGPAVEIAYFGLLAPWQGIGLGGWLLTQALYAAWAQPGVQCVWVHTCELDAPGALANYQARGMRIYRTDVEWRMG